MFAILSLFLGFAAYGQSTNDACREKFVDEIFDVSSHSHNYVLFNYRDSVGTAHRYLIDQLFLRHQLVTLKGMEPEKYVEFMRKKLSANDTVLFSEVGALNPEYELNDSRFVRQWKNKGREKFIHQYFDKKQLKTYPGYKLVATAYELGIIVTYFDGRGPVHYITYMSECK